MAGKQPKSVYVCQECGGEHLVWQGQCAYCSAWNSLTEMKAADSRKPAGDRQLPKIKNLSQLDLKEQARFSTGLPEVDRVLGGGIVAGSLILLGGEPGIGKSTLLLQLCEKIDGCLYVSAEESSRQVGLRAARLGIKTKKIDYLSATNLETILETIRQKKFQLIIIDSIQTIESEALAAAAGSVAQVKQVGLELQRFAKEKGCAVILVGHITKQGQIAGPKTLEHLVDAVVYLEGERMGALRLLRTVKNRFGTVNEVGVLEMSSQGLRTVQNPSKHFLHQRQTDGLGAVVSCTMEGLRPILIEIQALCHRTEFGYPKRTSHGFDLNRLNLIAAILESRAGINLSQTDIYLNVAGGIKVREVGVDTAVAMAVMSSFLHRPVKYQDVFWGELGLTGEIRRPQFHQKRLAEARNLGFSFRTAKTVQGLKNYLGDGESLKK